MSSVGERGLALKAKLEGLISQKRFSCCCLPFRDLNGLWQWLHWNGNSALLVVDDDDDGEGDAPPELRPPCELLPAGVDPRGDSPLGAKPDGSAPEALAFESMVSWFCSQEHGIYQGNKPIDRPRVGQLSFVLPHGSGLKQRAQKGAKNNGKSH